jgi:hypothetical protein
MKTVVKVKDKTQFEAIVALLLISGKKFSDSNSTLSSKEYTEKYYERFPYPIIDHPTMNCWNGTYGSYKVLNWPEQAEEILNVIFKKTYAIEDFCDYSAEVTEDGIKVGCQTIKFDKFDELVKLVKEFKEEQS